MTGQVQTKAPQQQIKKAPKYEYRDYLLFLHKKRVEVHISYGNTVLKLEGVLRSKAQYDIQLILDEKKKDIITINKGHIIMVKPL